MSFNGSGTFVINSTGQPVVTGTVISSSTFNSLTADLGTGLSTTVTKDGQTTTTAKIPFAQGLSAAAASNFAAGTVGLPAIYLSTDTTTGLYRIGANNDGFAVSGAKVLDIASTGLGITGTLKLAGATSGTTTVIATDAVTATITLPSATATLATLGANTFVGNQAITGALSVSTTLGVTGAATLSSTLAVTGAGDFGTTLQGRTITSLGAHTSGSFNAFIAKNSTAGTTFSGKFLFQDGNGNNGWAIANNQLVASGVLEFNDGATNRAYFSTGGAFLLNGGVSGFSATNTKLQVLGTAQDWTVAIGNNNATSAYGIYIVYSACTPNDGSTSFFIQGVDSSATRFKMLSNGGLSNFSANNVNLSDQREKKDIQLAGSYLEKICAIPVKTFLFNDQTDSDLNLGVIAQDVQAVAPELVSESDWGTKDEPKMRLSIYQTDLQYALMKSVQELAAKVAALEAK